MKKEYITKDSGKRQEYDSGMKRDTMENKPRYDLIYIPMITRLAELHGRGVAKYGDEIEEWKVIPSLKNIEASNFGNIRNNKTGIIYSKWINKHGYELVSLSNQKRKHYQVHRLIMESFAGESEMQVNHKDFNRTNNRIDNLEYMSQLENIKYSKNNDRYIGSLNSAIITFEIAEEIRKRIHLGEKQKDLAKEFKISPQTVCDINKRRIWNENAKIHKNLNARNWELANSEEELNRFKASAFRHFIQWFQGNDDEDHASAILFNVNAAEYLKDKLK